MYTEHTDYDYLLKIILIGDSGVGKSCLMKSFLTNNYSETYTSTIGVDFEIKHCTINNKKVNLQIWDTAGQERFRTITTSYYRSSDAVLLVFDVTEEQSFKNAKKWLDDVREYAQEFVDVVLVGNKVDLEDKRVVDFETAKNFANENMMPYVETSAKNGLNVESVFMSISKTSLSQKMARKEEAQKNKGISASSGVSLNSQNNEDSFGSCGC